jgi:hypothetical protein
VSTSTEPSSAGSETRRPGDPGEPGDQRDQDVSAAAAERSLWDWDPGVLRRIALSLLLLQALWRAWIALQGYFTGDDFVFTANAARVPMSLDYLLREHVGHLMPGAFALAKAFNAIGPLNYPLAVFVDLGIQATAGWWMYKLLVLLFGPRKGVIVPLAFFLFTPLTLDAFLWWAAALNHLPMQLGMVLTLYAHVRYVRERDQRWLLVALPSFLLALAFFEKAVLIPPYLLLFTYLYLTPEGSARTRLREAVLRHWPIWLMYGVVCAAYVALYLARLTFAFDHRPDAPTVAQLAGTVVGTTVIPGLFGGPWHFFALGFAGGAADPVGWAKWLTWELLAVGVVLSVFLRQRAARAWLLLAAYIAADIALLSIGRLAWIGPIIGQSYRYVADAAVPATLTLALLLMPVLGEQRTLTRIGEAAAAWLSRRRWIPVVAAVLAVNGFLFSAAFTTQQYAKLWSNNPARAYMTNAKSALANAPDDAVLLDEAVPADVLNGLFAPYNGTDQMFAPWRDRPRFGTSSTELWVMTPAGQLVPGKVGGVTSRPGPLVNCGWPVRDGGTETIPLTGTPYAWPWTVQVSYLAGKTTPAVISFGTGTRRVVLRKGLHDLFVSIIGSGSSIDITAKDKSAGICVDNVVVGVRGPRDPQPTGP